MVQWHPIDLCVWSHIKWGKEKEKFEEKNMSLCKFNLVKAGHLQQSLTDIVGLNQGVSLPTINFPVEIKKDFKKKR